MIAWLPERQPGVRPSAFPNLTVDITAMIGLENAPSIEPKSGLAGLQEEANTSEAA
ncbi:MULTISPECIES: hypothetical protein [Mesorhizobium]|uniref:hypothetical protein n=1 Tax=Mesorhizobium TaxID=68287 RepID=UPI0012EA9789|nr:MULTISPECIES: hypothetical protein [Mesorhizobium]QIA25395.1 hypothetical protein A9K68_029350 [Mesorhizobium sp. AA22]